jgi:hypothetical protein
MRLEMNRLGKDESIHQFATTTMQLVGDIAHLRSLGAGLFGTRHVIHRAIAAYEQSKELLAQIELTERKLHRRKGLQNDRQRKPA